ncbi:hypothetical protein E3N88_40579 [Mikania micrantha]|uniref:Reverse transcriptase domain-containing protein n=1 Tax=Mikania micrantha TaxID=192012 RepID=A0A5N6LMZ2_9ASTR|nr:hypothetical protein E3N88_40579 [Mikania micrantha]
MCSESVLWFDPFTNVLKGRHASICDDANRLWDEMAEKVTKAAKETLGMTTGNKSGQRESWWWNDEVQIKVREKQQRFREFVRCIESAQRERLKTRYKEAKREAKKIVSETKTKAYIEMYKRLETKEGEQAMFKIAKARMVDILPRSFQQELFNKSNYQEEDGGNHMTTGTSRDNCYCRHITKEEVFTALKMMGRRKAVDLMIFPLRCGNFWGMKERVIETRLRRETQVTVNLFGFMPGRSTMEAIHILRRLMEKYREKRKDFHMVFIDLEKAYDSVPRQAMWDILESRGIPQRYIEAIKDTYENAKTNVRAPVGDTDFFLVEVGLQQGSTLSPFLFAVILDDLSRSATRFKYLGSFIQDDGDINSDVVHRVQEGWKKWRAATSIICDRKFPERLKEPNQTAEMRMLRWMCGHTRLDRIRNEVFRERLQVANISDKVREGRLRWFGHVKRRSQAAPVRKVEFLTVEGKRGRGQPKLTWDEQIKHDLTQLHLSEDMIYDRSMWRRRIKAQDTSSLS